MASISAILKYLGAALTTFLGILGLIGEFRDQRSGRITRTGRLLLIGIVVSGVIVIATQIGDDLQQESARTELLEQIVRGQYPLRNVRLSCWTDVAMEGDLRRYRDRVLSTFTEAKTAITAGAYSVPGISGWGGSVDKPIDYISVCKQSQLFPSIETEAFAHSVFEKMEVMLHFYRRPVAVSAYPFHVVGKHRLSADLAVPDLTMTFRDNYSKPGNVCLTYHFDQARFQFEGYDLETESRYWNSSGKIISLLDLRGAQMFVEVTPFTQRAAGSNREMRAAPTPRMLLLQVDELDGLWITELTQHKGEDGLTYYEYRFPETLDGILRLSMHRHAT